MKLISFVLICLVLSTSYNFAQEVYATSNKALSLIIQEVVGTRGRVTAIYENDKEISRAKSLAESSTAYFYSGEVLTNLKFKNKINLADFLGSQALSSNDSLGSSKISNKYLWTDPISVKMIVKKIADTLGKISPEFANDFKINALNFEKKLDLIHKQVARIIAGTSNKRIIVLNKGLEYFCKRYSIEIEFNFNRNIETKELNQKQIESAKQNMNDKILKIIGFENNISLIDKEISFALKTNILYLDILGKSNQTKYSDFILTLARRMTRALN